MKKTFNVIIEEKALLWIDAAAARSGRSRTKYVAWQLENLAEKIRKEREAEHISKSQSKIKFK